MATTKTVTIVFNALFNAGDSEIVITTFNDGSAVISVQRNEVEAFANLDADSFTRFCRLIDGARAAAENTTVNS